MRAMGINEFGGGEKIKLLDLPAPEVSNEHSVIIRVKAAGVGIWDALMREGTFNVEDRTFPIVLGLEASGVIEKVGGKVDDLKVGDDVYTYFAAGGAYAEFIDAPQGSVAHKPEGVNYARAAALPVAAITAHQALVDNLDLKAGQTIAIAGASGGVGTMAVQLAKAIGATVIGITSSANVDYVKGLGADVAIDYSQGDPAGQVRALYRDGVDAAIDCVGGENSANTIKTVRSGGNFADLTGFTPESRDPTIGLFHIYAQPSKARLEVIAKLIADGRLRAEVARTFPLDQAKAAMELVETHHVRGKVVLTV